MCVGGFVGHFQGVTCVSTPNDYGTSKYVLSNSKDQSMKLWDLRKMNTTTELNSARKNLRGMTREFDYRYDIGVANAYKNHKALKGDKSLMTYRGHTVATTLIRSGFSPVHSTSAKYVFCGDANSCIYIYDTLTGENLYKLDGHDNIVRDVCWHPYLPSYSPSIPLPLFVNSFKSKCEFVISNSDVLSVIVSSSWDGSVVRWAYGDSKGVKVREKQENTGKMGKTKMTDKRIDTVDDDFKAVMRFVEGDDDGAVTESEEESDFEANIVSLDMPPEKRKRGNFDYW